MNIPEVYRSALDGIASMPDDQVVALRAALTGIGVTLKPPKLAAQVRARITSSFPQLEDIVQTLISLSSARAGSELSLDDFVLDVAKSVARRKDKPREFDEDGFAKRLALLLSVEALAVSARAAEIQHNYERVFASSRIISDIRSVFGTSNVEPVGAMIVHNLKITYFEEGRIREAFFAMDNADLAGLQEAIDRASQKTTKLENVIRASGLEYFESK